MSLSTPKKPVQRENPFLRVSSPLLPRQAGVAQAGDYPLPQRRVATHPLKSDSASALWKKKQSQLKLKMVLAACVGGIVLFALLPSGLQQRAFNGIGLGDALGQTVSSVPLPVDYDSISSPYGRRWGRLHQGIDLAARTGSPIYAASTGTIIHSGWESGYGQSVVIDHGHGLKTRYGHCSKVLMKAGLPVQKGQLIAHVGSTGHSTGPHLHFEVLLNGVRKNPAWYYPFDKVPHWHALKVSQGKNWLRDFSNRLSRWIKS